MKETITEVNLDDNKIGTEGLMPLVKWMDMNTQRCYLEVLSLENNLLGDNFAVSIC